MLCFWNHTSFLLSLILAFVLNILQNSLCLLPQMLLCFEAPALTSCQPGVFLWPYAHGAFPLSESWVTRAFDFKDSVRWWVNRVQKFPISCWTVFSHSILASDTISKPIKWAFRAPLLSLSVFIHLPIRFVELCFPNDIYFKKIKKSEQWETQNGGRENRRKNSCW